ncbi:MAG TPA: acyl-CoA dehydrogenase family protein [Catenuloplanes sp.]|jgi:alkylation response protein AidB-like acyl-CoA dehydrogenase
MTPSPSEADLERVVSTVVAPGASAVDRTGQFPRESIDALRGIGLLGLVSAADLGGAGLGMPDAARVVERVSRACGSSAMVLLMHYAAASIIEAHGPDKVRREVAEGRHLSTLAFSEAGSRSHFWTPLGTAVGDAAGVRLSARKSWVTSAGQADSYVWSSRPVAAPGPMTLWLMPANADGLTIDGPFDGLGLRGNDSRPVRAQDVTLPAEAMLGTDGTGLDTALNTALPWFLVLNAAFSIGLMEATLAETVGHLGATRLEHLGQTLAEQPLVRMEVGRMRLTIDSTRALLNDVLTGLAAGRPDATRLLLGVKAVAGEAALSVTDTAMRVGGGAAFRKDLGVERRFRDARAARVMAPTTEALTDFVARLTLGMPLFDAAPTGGR